MTKDNNINKGKSVVFDGTASKKGNVDRMGLDRYSTITRAPREVRMDLRNQTALDIPKEVMDVFSAYGWNLYWARVIDPKTKQGTNERINYFKSLGGQLVHPAMLLDIAGDVPQARDLLRRLTSHTYRETFADSFEKTEEGGEGLEEVGEALEETALRIDSMVLMMVPKAVREQKQKQIAREQQERMSVTQRKYKENTGDGTVNVQFNSSLLNKASDVFG